LEKLIFPYLYNVKNLEQLLELYRKDERTKLIAGGIEQTVVNDDEPNRFLLEDMKGGLLPFVVAATYHETPACHLIVAIDKEDAAYLQNTLNNLFDKKTIHFFPDSFKRPAEFQTVENHNILLRTETVNKVTNSKARGEIIVTYPEALFEKVVAPAVLNKSKIEIKNGESLDVDTILEVLIEYGFSRVDFVFEPGQFSIRGGIVDIFSYGNDMPYRVELFDDEVESIRVFNPLDQLSLKKIARVSIIPNIQTEFTQSQKVSLFKTLPNNTAIWINNVQNLIDRLQICFDNAADFADTLQENDTTESAKIMHERAFILPNVVVDEVTSRTVIEVGKSSYFEFKGDVGVKHIKYPSKPQPSFNKNFALLINDLNKNTEDGITNYIFTENPRQIERFYRIFEDLNANVVFHPIAHEIHQGFIDTQLKVACFTDHQIFDRFHKYNIKQGFTKSQSLNIKLLRELQPGDYVTHIDHGVGKYSGLEKIDINGHIQEAVRLIYKDNDLLYVSINSLHKISKYVGKEGKEPKIYKLGTDAWTNLKNKTKKKVKDIAAELIKLYAQRKAAKGHAFPPDNWLQFELESSFIYEDTPDQAKATQDVKEDMEKEYPMDRLICGDVGFGKTEVAIRAAFKAVTDGKQAAILVPTTILALQHAKTFTERLSDFPVKIDYVNRFRTAKQKTEIYKKLEKGEIDILIGTHAILNKKIKFKDLGLLIIDEEQKFGVAAKEKIRGMKVNVDTLTLTATPIPRTLQFSLMAARDLSVINTAPPNRQPIHTEVRVFDGDLIRDAIYYEVMRGGQVYFVHNRVKSLPEMRGLIQRLCPDIHIGMAHGQMTPNDLEATLVDFIDKKYDVLVCTNIIETGLDIPNANTIMINNAHHFGLSDLHQLRGRVGRSNKKAFCYLMAPPISVLPPDSRRRLTAIEEFSDLGSGLNIAMRDLDIRGAGNILGGEQSGFITDIGYETYQKILDEAIQELKEGDFKELFKEEVQKEQKFVRDVQIDTDIEMMIPDEYVNSIQERLRLYTELDNLETDEEVRQFAERVIDRFGPLPQGVKELFNGLKLRWICKKLGFERIILKNNKLRCYFVSNPQSPFYESALFQKVIMYVNGKGDSKMGFKKSGNYFLLVREGVKNITEAKAVLKDILLNI
jgi:transcription-repair coupling factor (superfamily II helicase)